MEISIIFLQNSILDIFDLSHTSQNSLPIIIFFARSLSYFHFLYKSQRDSICHFISSNNSFISLFQNSSSKRELALIYL